MTDGDLQYIAGFFDGEGCIVISPRKGKPGQYDLKVSIVNTNREILLWIAMRLGVGRTSAFPKDNRNRPIHETRPCYFVIWGERKAERVLSELLPFLKVKRSQAEIALKFRETYPRGRWSTKEIPRKVADQREQLRQSLVVLKRPKEQNLQSA